VGGDDDGGAEPVQFDEEPQQPARERRVDIAGRFVGEQDLRLFDQRPGDRRALLLAARQDGRQHMHALAEADPFEKLDHVAAIARLLAAAHAQRQGHVLVGRHVVEQAEILEHDADAAAQERQFAAGDSRPVLAEDGDQPARRAQRQEEQAQQRRLARAGRAGQELEGAFGDVEGDVPQDLRPHPVSQPDIFEANQRESPVLLWRAIAGAPTLVRHG
jgi:hypothetical protein